jgi:hypothetical protein
MRPGAHTIGAYAGACADRADLHARADLRHGGAGGDEARGKK